MATTLHLVRQKPDFLSRLSEGGLAPKSRAFSIGKRPPLAYVVAPQCETRLPHPRTKLTTFGFAPAIAGENVALGVQPIFLTYGRQGHEKGMGALHIWQRHGGNLTPFGVSGVETVAQFVAQVIRPGTSLYWQKNGTDQIRIAAYRDNIGTVILGHRIWRKGPRWEVITAFAGEPWEGPRMGEIT